MPVHRHVLRGGALLGLVAGMSLGTGTAEAARIASGGSTLHYVAATGETNNLNLTADRKVLVLTDTGAAPSTRLPSHCTQDPTSATLAVRCTGSGRWLLKFELKDGDDQLEAEPLPRRFTLRIDAGQGDNIVAGGYGDDHISAGSGRDTLYGGYGNDTVSGGEGDNYVRGNDGDDDLRAGSGIDFLIGDEGNDVLRGGGELDFIFAGSGDDVAIGGAGPDSIDLEEGNDTGYGDAGADEVSGGPGADRMYGGAGDDLLQARDGQRDRLDCGGGSADAAAVDRRIDEVSRSCEAVSGAAGS